MKAIQSTEPVGRGEGKSPFTGSGSTPAWVSLIRQAVESVDFGTVQIKVHGGDVVQIETTRKIRVSPDLPGDPSRLTARAEASSPRR